MFPLYVEYSMFENSVLSEHKCQILVSCLKWGRFLFFLSFFFLFGVIYLEKNKLVFGAIVLKNDRRENDKQVSTIRTSNAESS